MISLNRTVSAAVAIALALLVAWTMYMAARQQMIWEVTLRQQGMLETQAESLQTLRERVLRIEDRGIKPKEDDK